MAQGSSNPGPGKVIPFWLDGKQITSELTFPVESPVDQSTLYSCSAATEEDVSRAVASAQRAEKEWAKTKPNFRRDIFLRAANIFDARRKEIREYGRIETGASEHWFNIESHTATDALRSVAGLIQVATTSSAPITNSPGRSAILRQEPYGVVLAIAPWNAPNVLGLRAVLGPLAMGNTVVLKGPENAPATFWALSSVLHEAGLPPGCLNTIYHRPSDAAVITEALISKSAVQKINFTGSTAVGSIVASLAGKHLKPSVMELGGKASAIVCEDANIETAAMHCALGGFLHAGQICMSTERIIVRKEVADQFRQAIKKALGDLHGENGFGVPQMAASRFVNRNKTLLFDAASKGGKALFGDLAANDVSGTRLPAVLLEQVKPNMDIYYQESFGPTASLYVVDSDQEAVKLANDTSYGLSNAVFSCDLRRAMRLADELESGAVHINSMTVHDDVALPHGGHKESGFGRFNGLLGLSEWTRTKAITWDE